MPGARFVKTQVKVASASNHPCGILTTSWIVVTTPSPGGGKADLRRASCKIGNNVGKIETRGSELVHGPGLGDEKEPALRNPSSWR